MTTFSTPVKWYPLWAAVVLVIVIIGFLLVESFHKYQSWMNCTPLVNKLKNDAYIKRKKSQLSYAEEGKGSKSSSVSSIRLPRSHAIRQCFARNRSNRGSGKNPLNPNNNSQNPQINVTEDPVPVIELSGITTGGSEVKVPPLADLLELRGAGVSSSSRWASSSATGSTSSNQNDDGFDEGRAGPSTSSPR
jgi:hypothetical protein